MIEPDISKITIKVMTSSITGTRGRIGRFIWITFKLSVSIAVFLFKEWKKIQPAKQIFLPVKLQFVPVNCPALPWEQSPYDVLCQSRSEVNDWSMRLHHYSLSGALLVFIDLQFYMHFLFSCGLGNMPTCNENPPLGCALALAKRNLWLSSGPMVRHYCHFHTSLACFTAL